MFLDDTACNLASMNLLTFLKDGKFDAEAYVHATRLWTVTLEISVMMAQFPSQGNRPASATTSAPSASATPTSAAC